MLWLHQDLAETNSHIANGCEGHRLHVPYAIGVTQKMPLTGAFSLHYRQYYLRYDVKFKGPWDVIESRKKLFRVLRERNLEFAAHSFNSRPPPAFAGADVWLLAALLQKAIRRGDLVVARRAGHQLLEVDPARVCAG